MFDVMNIILSSVALLGLPVAGIMLVREIITLWKL